jgi:hypothetical protein
MAAGVARDGRIDEDRGGASFPIIEPQSSRCSLPVLT